MNWAAILSLALGFLAFGTVLGGVVGASSATGISTTFLTSLLTFIGGAFFSFAGFKLRGGTAEDLTVEPGRIGLCMLTLSLGIWAGGVPTAYLRVTRADEFQAQRLKQCKLCGKEAAALKLEEVVHLLHGGTARKLCDRIKPQLKNQEAYRDQRAEVIAEDVEALVGEFCSGEN